MMKKNKLSDEQIKAVLDAFHDALDHGPWASSALLRVLGQKLQDFSSQFEDKSGVEQAENAREQAPSKTAALSETSEHVFIGLYSSDGANLRSWEQILVNLPRQMVSRPVYASEEDIKKAIRAREVPMNEAYVAVEITPQNILVIPEDRVPKDRLGTALLTLKDKSLSLEHVIRFVHATGEYDYIDGRLIKK